MTQKQQRGRRNAPTLSSSLRDMDEENKNCHHLRDWRGNNTLFRSGHVSVRTTGWGQEEEAVDGVCAEHSTMLQAGRN